MSEFSTVVTALQSGGNAALIVAVYFIHKATERLARIEKALEKYLQEKDGNTN